MFGEKPVRHSVTPISSAIETKRFLKISNSIGSMRILGLTPPRSACSRRSSDAAGRRPHGDDVAEGVDAEAVVPAGPPPSPARRRRRQARPLSAPGEQILATIEHWCHRWCRRRNRRQSCARGVAGDERRCRRRTRQRRLLRQADGLHAQVDDLGRPRRVRVAVAGGRGADRTRGDTSAANGTVISYDCPM